MTHEPTLPTPMPTPIISSTPHADPHSINGQNSSSYVFISYSSQDRAFVEKLRAYLQQNQISYWVDQEGIPIGASSWELKIREAIRGATHVIYVVSPHSFESNVVQGEIALAQMQKLTIFPAWAHGETFINCIPLAMAHAQYVDLRGERFEAGMARLVQAIRSTKSDLAYAPPRIEPLPAGTPPRNPYKGLQAFTQDDARDFFGREKLIRTLTSMIQERLSGERNRLIAVIGPSGSGKSSVVMAGLLPKLTTDTLEGSSKWLYLNPFTPGGDPLENLAFELKRIAPPGFNRPIRKELDAVNGAGLVTIARDLVKEPGQQLVVYIDQFEELFTLVSDEADREQFINTLVRAVIEPDSPVLVILTLRADFYDRPMNYNALGTLIEENNRSVLPLTLGELNDAITLPTQLPDVQMEFEGDLVAEIAFDLLEFRDPADKTTSLAGALPLLQFALSRLFERRSGKLLTLDAYREMGGVSGAIGSHAEEEYRKLNATEDRVLHRVFYHLVNIDDQSVPTRRRARRSDITQDDPEAETLVESLIRNRLLVIGKDQMVEVAHEALLRSWKRLADWIAENGHHIQTLQDVQEAAFLWVEQGKADRLLWDYEELLPVYDAIDALHIELDTTVREFVRPQTDRLLEDFKTSPEYRQLSILDRWREIGRGAAPALVNALVYVKSDAVLDAIDAALWEMPEAAKDALIATLADPDHNMRIAVAQAISRLGVADAIDGLLNNISGDRRGNNFAEIEALCSISRNATPAQQAQILPVLISVLQERTNRYLDERCAAAQAVGKLGVRNPQVVQALLQGLKDKNWEVRRDCALALGQLRAAEAWDALNEKTHAPGESYHTRRAVLIALGRLRNSKAMTTLINAAVDPNEDIRCAAVQALGDLRSDGALSMLMYRLRDDSMRVREATAQALAKFVHAHAVRPLVDALQSEKAFTVRVAIINALCVYADRTDVPPALRDALNDDTPTVRAAAAAALGIMHMQKGQTIPALLRVLEEKKLDPDVRSAVIRALATLKTPQALPALLKELSNNRRWQTRFEAALALAQIGEKSVLPDLNAILEGKDRDMVFAAAVALAGLGDQGEMVRQQLYQGLRDPRIEVRCLACEAFGKLKEVKALPQLMEALRGRDDALRLAAAGAIAALMPLDAPTLEKLQVLHTHPFIEVREAVTVALQR